MKKSSYMEQALVQARSAAGRGEVPVGAVLVDSRSKEAVAASGNRVIELCDPTAHAELLTIRAACQALGTERIASCDLYVTLEPCAMCAGALIWSRIKRLIFGARDNKTGAVFSKTSLLTEGLFNHNIEVIEGVLAKPCRQILQNFFVNRRPPN